MTAQIIWTDGREEAITLSEDLRVRYEKVKEIVNGIVEQMTLYNGKTMYFNGEGKIMGLSTNFKATSLAKNNLSANEFVVGNVVVV